MNGIKSYHLIKEGGNYVLVVQLDQIDTEFSNEYGEPDELRKKRFYDDIKSHIEDKFPKIKIPLCKIMVGSILVATIPIASGSAVFAATETSMSQPAETIEYKVMSGDTLWKISQKFGVSVGDIKTLNSLLSDTIFLNEILKIPNTSSQSFPYTVQAGDTLSKIALLYGTDVAKIKSINNLTSDTIFIGQTLIIVGQATTTAPPLSETGTYKVVAGDTLWKISTKINMSIDQLKKINNLQTDTIFVGQVLKTEVPSLQPTISYKDYQIKSGDNLWKISIEWGIPQSELMLVNGLNESSMLTVGQIIRIPVHNIPVKETIGARYGEHLDWWTEAQYVVPINKVVKVTDFETGKTFTVKRTIGANHSDTEPLTYIDTEIAKSIWGEFSWKVRPIIIEVDGRKIAASMSFMPHGVQYIGNNQFDGHFDIHFLNSTRHNDGQMDSYHQNAIKIAAGITGI
jgi:LysM repeat protein